MQKKAAISSGDSGADLHHMHHMHHWIRPFFLIEAYRLPGRTRTMDPWFPPEAPRHSLEAAEATVSLGVVLEGLEEPLAVEVRPQNVREVQLCVRRLPQQEVREASLA